MKSLGITLILLFVFNTPLFSQESKVNTWTIGSGISNFAMHGDLTSNTPNLGYYLYLNKMITPVFGFELKGQLLDMKGSSQDMSSSYSVLYTSNSSDNLRFVGDSFGGELNLVINFSNLLSEKRDEKKLNFASYFGIGYHTYNTKLFDDSTDELLIDFSNINATNHSTKSIFYTSAIGLKYRLSDRLDLELRQAINFNNEDHLDATISKKQQLETFFTTQLGIVIKLHKNSRNANNNDIVEDTNVIEEITPKKQTLNFKDSDNDGVIDQFDKEPNTDKNALVYANGVTIDSDKDGVPDHIDKCPLIPGNNKDGCNNTINKTVKEEIKQIKNIVVEKKDNTKAILKNPTPIKQPKVVVHNIPERINTSPNANTIKELNKNNIKHNVYELDNSVNYLQIENAPVYPGCEERLTELDKKNCLVNKINIYTLTNVNLTQSSDKKLNKGFNSVRTIFVIDENGKAKVFKTLGNWSPEVIKEISRVIESLPTIKPGKLNNLPTPVKFSIELPFKVK